MKNSFWLFRSNIKDLEYYHKYLNLKEFKEKCFDFYLLQGINFLENKVFDEVVIWRLSNKDIPDIIFDINGKLFIQRFVKTFNECFKYESPNITFFRGGFREYDELMVKNNKFFNLSLYLGASKRKYPKDNIKYVKVLVEDNNEILSINHIPFYKTANSNIFKPLKNQIKKYDICFPSNFTQLFCKGQDYFIKQISKSSILKNLNICHVGNKEDIGYKICKDYGVTNIIFLGKKDRFELNEILNQSNLGIVCSDKKDGCPRILTEILMSGIPIMVRRDTRFLRYYRDMDIVRSFHDNNLEKAYLKVIDNYNDIKKLCNKYIKTDLSMDKICKINLDLWIK